MSRKIAMYSILAFVLSLVFCGSFLSSDTYAAGRLGNYTGYSTNLRNSTNTANFSGNIVANNNYSALAPASSAFFIANGNFSNAFSFQKGNNYYVVLNISLRWDCNAATPTAQGLTFIPEAIQLFNSDGNFRTVNDNVSISYGMNSDQVSSGSTSRLAMCYATIIHNIEVEVLTSSTSNLKFYTPSSNLIAGYNYASDAEAFYFTVSNYMFNSSDEVEQYLGSIDSKINSVASGVASTNTKLDTANDLQVQANQDANDRYDDEKQTISDNADGGIESVNDIDTSFTLPNIFGIILGDLSVQTCYSIPTLASFVHSSNTQYCAWFPASVRTAMSALVDVIVLFIVCSFIWSWVKKGGL